MLVTDSRPPSSALVHPVKSDPSRAAKTAITDALYRIGAPELAVYRTGIRHVQLEPVWGGKADTATALRATCALALVRVHYPDYLTEIADLLADREAPARKTAAQPLAYSENPAAVPLLRLKALIGDDDPQVLLECLLALLAITPVDRQSSSSSPFSIDRGGRDRRGRRARPRRFAHGPTPCRYCASGGSAASIPRCAAPPCSPSPC